MFKCNGAIGPPRYGFSACRNCQSMHKQDKDFLWHFQNVPIDACTKMWPNLNPFRDTSLQNLNDLEFDLSGSFNVKSNGAI